MLEPIIEYFDSVNRNAITVKAKKPFYDWITYVDPAFPMVDDDEGTVYLIREMDTSEKIERWLKKNFDQIFVNEMNNYHTLQEDWPQKRTYKIFREWFTVEICSMVVDMLETPLVKD